MDIDRKNIYIAQIFRVTTLIILAFPIPLTYRLLLLYLTDLFDCDALKLFSTPNCHTTFYQVNDKIIDILIYIVVMIYFLINYSKNPMNYVLIGFLLHRIIGVYKFIITENNDLMIYFPDVFRELSIYVAMIHDGFVENKLSVHIIVTMIIILAKIQFEKMLHSKKIIHTTIY